MNQESKKRTDLGSGRTTKTRVIRCRAFKLLTIVAGLLSLTALPAQAQHGHLDAGAVSPDAGVPLTWVNGALFATNSGYVQNMPLSTSGRFDGYYNSGPTMTALATSGPNASPFAALQSSFVNVEIKLLSAPEGGMFGFWEMDSVTPTFNLSLGGTTTTPLIALSDATLGAGGAGADPFGHIHGRRFSATVPGEYLISLQLFDTSDVGPGATPLHTPSDLLYMQFVTVVPEPSVMALMSIGLLSLGMWRRSRSKAL